MKSYHQIKQPGFTLIEVLIALVILAIAMSAIVLAVQANVKDTIHIKEKMAAHWVAVNVLSGMQIKTITPPAETGQVEGDMTLLNIDWHWQAKVVVGEEQYYERIAIDVFQKDNEHRTEHLEGFILKSETEQ